VPGTLSQGMFKAPPFKAPLPFKAPPPFKAPQGMFSHGDSASPGRTASQKFIIDCNGVSTGRRYQERRVELRRGAMVDVDVDDAAAAASLFFVAGFAILRALEGPTLSRPAESWPAKPCPAKSWPTASKAAAQKANVCDVSADRVSQPARAAKTMAVSAMCEASLADASPSR